MATQFNTSDLYNGSLSSLNTKLTASASNGFVRSVDPQMSGKYYVEFTKNTNSSGSDAVGVANASVNSGTWGGGGGAWVQWVGNTNVNGVSQTSLGLFWGSCDMAVDLDNKKIWFRTDGGNWNGSGAANPATNTGGWDITAICAHGLFPAIGIVNSGGIYSANFGDTAFSRSAPSGFVAWPTLAAGVKIDPPAVKTNGGITASSLSVSGVKTSDANATVLAVINMSGGSRSVSSVSDTSGLTWTLRKRQTYNGGASAVEIWSAVAASQLTGVTITATLNGATTNGMLLSTAAILGNGSSNILFDDDVSLPDATSGTGTTASVTGANTGIEGMVLSIFGTGGGGFSGAPAAPTGYSNVASVYGGISTGMVTSFSAQYHSSAISGGSSSLTIPSSTAWAGIIDAIEVSSDVRLTASIADDTGVSATLSVWFDFPFNIRDEGELAATITCPPLLVANIADDNGLTATLGSSGRDYNANIVDDFGLDATLEVRDPGDLLARLKDDNGLSATLVAATATIPVQQCVICV